MKLRAFHIFKRKIECTCLLVPNECKINFGKNLAPSRTTIKNTKEDEEATNLANMKPKVRSPKTWLSASWYQDEDGHSTKGVESQKSEVAASRETPGNKDHEGVINFYIGDHQPTNAGMEGGEAPGVKWIKTKETTQTQHNQKNRKLFRIISENH